MDLSSYSETLNDIYLVSNTPYYLYSTMRENPIIHRLAQLPTEELTKEFEKRTESLITKTSDIAEIYAIFIALTYKPAEEVEPFFREKYSIKFEWFSNIAQYYLDSCKPQITFSNIVIKPTVEPLIKLNKESSNISYSKI